MCICVMATGRRSKLIFLRPPTPCPVTVVCVISGFIGLSLAMIVIGELAFHYATD